MNQTKAKIFFHPVRSTSLKYQNNTKLSTYIYLPSEHILQKENEVKATYKILNIS